MFGIITDVAAMLMLLLLLLLSQLMTFNYCCSPMQDTEKQLIDCRQELRKLRAEKQKKDEKNDRDAKLKRGNANNNNENVHGGNHRNCLTCRLLNKLQLGFGNCDQCQEPYKLCQCQKGGKLPASIRREIDDYEIPWPEKGSKHDWRQVPRREEKEGMEGEKDKKSGNANGKRKGERKRWDSAGRKEKTGRSEQHSIERERTSRDAATVTKSEPNTGSKHTRSKVSFAQTDDARLNSATENEMEEKRASQSDSYTVVSRSERKDTIDSLLEKPYWLKYLEE